MAEQQQRSLAAQVTPFRCLSLILSANLIFSVHPLVGVLGVPLNIAVFFFTLLCGWTFAAPNSPDNWRPHTLNLIWTACVGVGTILPAGSLKDAVHWVLVGGLWIGGLCSPGWDVVRLCIPSVAEGLLAQILSK